MIMSHVGSVSPSSSAATGLKCRGRRSAAAEVLLPDARGAGDAGASAPSSRRGSSSGMVLIDSAPPARTAFACPDRMRAAASRWPPCPTRSSAAPSGPARGRDARLERRDAGEVGRVGGHDHVAEDHFVELLGRPVGAVERLLNRTPGQVRRVDLTQRRAGLGKGASACRRRSQLPRWWCSMRPLRRLLPVPRPWVFGARAVGSGVLVVRGSRDWFICRPSPGVPTFATAGGGAAGRLRSSTFNTFPNGERGIDSTDSTTSGTSYGARCSRQYFRRTSCSAAGSVSVLGTTAATTCSVWTGSGRPKTATPSPFGPAEDCLDPGRVDFQARADDHVLLAVEDAEVAVRVHR